MHTVCSVQIFNWKLYNMSWCNYLCTDCFLSEVNTNQGQWRMQNHKECYWIARISFHFCPPINTWETRLHLTWCCLFWRAIELTELEACLGVIHRFSSHSTLSIIHTLFLHTALYIVHILTSLVPLWRHVCHQTDSRFWSYIFKMCINALKV